jgi:xanthine dehydrogenase YagT iron-sulfur-binding subunit
MKKISRRKFVEGTSAGIVVAAAIPAVEAQQKTAPAAVPQGVPRTTIRINVNGVDRRVEVEDRWTLVELLRDHLNLTGTKIGANAAPARSWWTARRSIHAASSRCG